MTHLKILSLTLISFFFIACGGASDASITTAETSSYEHAEKTTQDEILNAINEARAVARDCQDGNGLISAAPALIWNSDLYSSAYEHSYDLAQSNTFSHYGSGTASDVTGSNNGDSSYFNDRIKANGYVGYKTIGENIAGGQATIEEAISAWLVSPAHCTNLMNSNFKEIGVAVVSDENSEYGIYWTQSFGAKK
ncbi:MAG: Transporter [uncultured Sulfurovum sp.]|uniref:Transporter n=1 Tax=uncultured Sulfurovum sp. TaxID=269237 RepID=A0A6S6U591_9BACT|nr:MAG: Transporter [uncultured Sulfurovum sp.]